MQDINKDLELPGQDHEEAKSGAIGTPDLDEARLQAAMKLFTFEDDKETPGDPIKIERVIPPPQIKAEDQPQE